MQNLISLYFRKRFLLRTYFLAVDAIKTPGFPDDTSLLIHEEKI